MRIQNACQNCEPADGIPVRFDGRQRRLCAFLRPGEKFERPPVIAGATVQTPTFANIARMI